jgi:hypothetical protein
MEDDLNVDATAKATPTNVDMTASRIKTFTKEQLLQSKKFMHQKDLINALLEDNKSYSLDDVDKILDNFLKGDVK